MFGLTDAAVQLLRRLAGQGAYGFYPFGSEPRMLVVVCQWNGVSLRCASAPLAAAEELESEAFAAWHGGLGTRRRLMLTAHGWNAVNESFALEMCEGTASEELFPPHADADAELWLPAST